jgi:hypothetical protein
MGRAILFLGLILVLIGGILLLGEKYGVKTHLIFGLGEKIGRSTSRSAHPYWSVLF